MEEPDPEELAKSHMVFVEPTYIKPEKVDGQYILLPYKERRHNWGVISSLGFNMYQPKDYEPAFSNKSFSKTFKSATAPLIELQFGVKRNLGFGSVGFEAAIGQYSTTASDSAASDTSLSITPWRVGALVAFDSFGKDARFVPYVSGGLYSIMFRESIAGAADNGSTQIAPYLNAGMAFGLDWIDRSAARIAYEQSGMEQSYLYLEVRSFFKSTSRKDRDFSDLASPGGGFRVEF